MNNTYSISKTTVERFIDMFNNNRRTCVNIVRAMNAYGPRQVPAYPYGPSRVRKITPSFCCRALKGDDIEIYGDGLQVSDMVWVGDVATALVVATEKAVAGECFERPVEIGPKKNNTVLEVAQLIKRLADSESRIVHLPMRPGEVPGSTVIADTSTLRQVDMYPENLLDLETGMCLTVEYFSSYLR
jgi:UDP-glucose 4-epimerase